MEKVLISIFGLGIIYYILLYIKYGKEVFFFKKSFDNIDIKKHEENIEKKEEFIKIITKNNNNINNFTILAENNKEGELERPAELDVKDITLEIDDVRGEVNEFIDIDNVLSALDQQEQKLTDEDNLEDLLNDAGIDIKKD